MSFAPGSEIICDVLFYFYLAWVAWQDHESRLVLRASHLPGACAVLLRDLPRLFRMAGSGVQTDPEGMRTLIADIALWEEWEIVGGRLAVLLLCLACEGFYRYFRFYGLADSLVFMNCCLYFLGVTDIFSCFFLFWWMKACSGLMLLCRESFRRRGLRRRLEEPTAYIPYILCAFALTNVVLKGYNVWY
ncbi:MAG: hypothetical protein LUE16_01055 [Lachnospiraceae bacterium]|nr:hypothetical protein [Lachnospiraceae bacterium]